MQKLIEVNAAKEFAGTFLGDPILKMTVNAVLDHAPAAEIVTPAVQEPVMGHDIAELCYRNGEEAMREKVIDYLREQKSVTMGAIRSALNDAIEKVRKL